MKDFVVMGSPIGHSLSPTVHNLFAKQFNIPIQYIKQDVTTDNLQHKLNEFFSSGGVGANLTSPLKEKAIDYVSFLSGRATNAKSINTISIKDNKLYGDNTDGLGFIHFLTNMMFCP